MKSYTFRVTIEDDVEAESEDEARRAFIDMVEELGIENYVLAKDLEKVSEEDVDEE